jgi:ABC-type antimicrobial peptide transport system permease subunit
LARFVLDIPGGADGAIWLAGVAGGLILVVLAGWISTRRLRKMSAMSLLRGV